MEERLSKSAILERLHTEYDRLIAAVSHLTPQQRIEPGAVGDGSVKDVLAHLIFWTRFPVQEVEYVQVVGRPLDFSHDDPDEINARIVGMYRHLSLEQIIANLELSFRLAIACIEALPDEAFEPDSALECLLGDTISGTFSNNTYEHYALHRGQLETWMEHVGVANG